MCEYLVKRLRPGTEVVSRTMGNKVKLINDCGETAALLLHDNCQSVVIVWDVRPPWSLQKPIAEEFCLHEEREGILESLKKAEVNPSDVRLVCVCQELETWLIADNRAIAKAISRLTRHKEPKIKEEKNPESVKDPKARLIKIFKKHKTYEYQAYYHALRIVKELPDFDKINRCQSFRQFVKATDTTL